MTEPTAAPTFTFPTLDFNEIESTRIRTDEEQLHSTRLTEERFLKAGLAYAADSLAEAIRLARRGLPIVVAPLSSDHCIEVGSNGMPYETHSHHLNDEQLARLPTLKRRGQCKAVHPLVEQFCEELGAFVARTPELRGYEVIIALEPRMYDSCYFLYLVRYSDE